MNDQDQHYSTELPNAKVKYYTISTSLKKHLYIFKTLPAVFSFKKIDLGTKVFIENMIIPVESKNLLDLGCGYGVIGIVLAYLSPQSNVYLTDINKRAIWCTKENIESNLPDWSSKILALHGSYFNPLRNKGLKFEAIYINPPLRKGRKEFLNLFQEIPEFLVKGGFFQFVIKRKMGAEFILNYLKRNNKTIEIICKRSGYWVFNYIQED